ncbi:MAG TPA: hypothetical protein VGL53_15080 [Bryobacteraceae bacterium]|jgi:hypothetical protein
MTKNEALTDLAAVLRESPASLPRVESGPAPLTPAQAYRNSNQTPAQSSSVSSLLTQLLPSLTGSGASSGLSAASLLSGLVSGSSATSSSSSGLAGTIGSAIGGGLSPLITSLAGLFGGGSKSTPAPLPLYSAPQSIQLQSAVRGGVVSSADSNQAGLPRSNSSAGQPQLTMNIQAMDSQSIMNRSSDIASAVRQAMLQSHPINDVVADL